MTLSDQEVQEKLARQRAETDQAVEGVKNVARGAASFYKTLIEEGVPSSHARDMVQGWVSALVMRRAEPEEEEE